MIGQTLGPYEILAKIGEGGMGKVYRARDTRLGRDVAIKVVTDALADEGRARFEREVRAASALTHPYICAVHDVAAGPWALVPGSWSVLSPWSVLGPWSRLWSPVRPWPPGPSFVRRPRGPKIRALM